MLKKIRVEQLEIGMYVHSLCGAWLSHDFWRTSFLLDKPELLAKLQDSPVQEVWIDTARGAGASINTSMSAVIASTQDTAPAPLSQELQRAAEICAEAKEAVVQMFSEVRMGQAVDVVMAETLVNAISNSVERHPYALLSVARLKSADSYTYMHSVAVSGLMVALARTMGWRSAELLQAGMAGLLHDIGKAKTDLTVLNKPGALSDEEFGHMKQHPVKGHAILQTIIDDEDVLDACLHHHERMDGKGYPHGLSGSQLSQLARMTAICDVYDAITSNRPYKKGWSPSDALQHMAQWCPSHLDADLFETFVRTIGLYPVGSLVRLQSGLLGVVCASAQHSMSTPKVIAFYHIATQRMLRPAKLLDLEQLRDERIVASENPEKWPFSNLDSLWRKAAQSLN